ncbi:Bug family tripartite tricarboxylate transporter substrate binding protein [Delftia acidovorans]|uniref:Tripartite tricarboxylate transporter substrate binding protein n=1 Tax=Delftia acidovorans TaxID=80866 RepID=A0AAJ2QX52_DELAC|nr:tripartite tricarboxylate transporter substrate binding protein [Delftia acidovorans]MDX4951883.1 tripartite tricarboxylate transporter substrate binding protein [Delftia acidovorans]
MTKRMKALKAAVAAAALAGMPLAYAAGAAGAAGAGSYPERPIRLVVPYAVGGATDVIARVAARYLGETLGQAVVVENRPGAGGSTGSAYAAKQPADGYTLVMMVESSHAVNPNVYAKPAYDPVKDFTPITNIANVPGVMVVSAGSAYKSAKDVSDAARAAPGKLNYGSSGNGGLSHLSGALFGSTTGTTLTHVPYKGLGPALNDLMAGQLDVVFDNMPSSGALIAGGQLRALAVSSPVRLPALPGVPTYAEAGLKPMNDMSWYGLGAPARLDPAILARLSEAMRKTLQKPELIKTIEQQGAVVDFQEPAQFRQTVERSNRAWSQLIRDIGFEQL